MEAQRLLDTVRVGVHACVFANESGKKKTGRDSGRLQEEEEMPARQTSHTLGEEDKRGIKGNYV